MVFKFNLGDEVVDQINGFRGVITVRSECLTGCNRYLVEPPVNKKSGGANLDGRYCDENTLKLMKAKKLKLNLNVSTESKERGPRPDPPRPSYRR